MNHTDRLSKGERIEREAWARGDQRERCGAEGHLVCTRCGVCACATDLDWSEYPSGTARVSTDKKGRTFCRECRYQQDEMGNR